MRCIGPPPSRIARHSCLLKQTTGNYCSLQQHFRWNCNAVNNSSSTWRLYLSRISRSSGFRISSTSWPLSSSDTSRNVSDSLLGNSRYPASPLTGLSGSTAAGRDTWTRASSDDEDSGTDTRWVARPKSGELSLMSSSSTKTTIFYNDAPRSWNSLVLNSQRRLGYNYSYTATDWPKGSN